MGKPGQLVWSGPDWMAIYSSKQDSRCWVPKKRAWMGWTLNFGHYSAGRWLLLLMIFLTVVSVGSLAVVATIFMAK